MGSILLSSIAAVFLVSFFVWINGLIFEDSSLADVGWGLYFVAVAIILYLTRPLHTHVELIDVILVSIWGVRLAFHIGKRKIGKPEDWRYAKWREEWGITFFVRNLLQNYLLQAVLALVISASTIVIANSTTTAKNTITWYQILAIIIWIIGFAFESIGDWQLSKFIKTRKKPGTVMKLGLWKYSRHPNYFGEVTQWWALWILAIGYHYGLVAVVSPILITFLILFVSGIPLLEKKYKDNPDYQEYKKTTPKLVPFIKVKS